MTAKVEAALDLTKWESNINKMIQSAGRADHAVRDMIGSMDKLETRLRSIAGQNLALRVDLDVGGVADFDDFIKKLTKQEKQTLKLDVDVEESELQQLLRKLQGVDRSLSIDLDVDESDLESTRSALRSIADSLDINLDIDDSDIASVRTALTLLADSIDIALEIDDQNIIADTVYDDAGRVQQTVDVRQNVTYQVYDDVTGRRIMTIANYVPQSTSDPADWAWSTGNSRWEYSAGQAVDHGIDNDQNIISHTTYDLAGRVSATRDVAGIETRFEYDELGRRVKTIHNYVDGVFAAANPDEDLISETAYNVAGQVILTTDARGTQTAFTYDVTGRRVTITQAVDTYLETMSYTCYDKAGRVLRTIQNYHDNGVAPDARDETSGAWLFNPGTHGSRNDRNLITTFGYDKASRRTKVTDPAGNVTTTTYLKDGAVDTVTDPEGVDSLYRYDGLRRRDLVVQNFVGNGEDPEDWVWDAGDSRYEESDGTTIAHATNNDQNIIVQVVHDVVGRMTSLRDPRGEVTSYEYDQLNRRTKLTNPLSDDWVTGYEDLTNGGTRTTQTYPGLATGGSYDVERDFDRLGRLNNIDYGSPTVTPDVALAYDIAGNRVKMTENDGTSDIRITNFGYDDVRRLTSVGFDNDGNGSDDETVSYAYDAGGLRTQMTLPGSKVIAYSYDARGRLIGLSDWDDQHSDFHYDRVGRHVGTQRANSLLSDYHYDEAGRLRRVRHLAGQSLRGQFSYEVDGRGNRTQAIERVATDTDITTTYDRDDTTGTPVPVEFLPDNTSTYWEDDGTDFRKTAKFSSSMKLNFAADEALLTVGVGRDHGLFDIYINGWFWRSLDGYEDTENTDATRVIHLPEVKAIDPPTTNYGTVEIRVRSDKNANSNGRVFRFSKIQLIDETVYADTTIDYTYDNLSRLQQADFDNGDRVHDYNFDLAGNRLQEALSGTGVTAKTTDFEYNAANQVDRMRVDAGAWTDFTYDSNGNLVDDGTNDYTWDRANRLLEVDNGTPAELAAFAYDGLGNRISQAIGTTSPTVTQFLLDTQPGLVKVLAQTTGGNTDRFIHAPRGIHAMESNAGDWSYMAQDGLGSVRSEIDSLLKVSAVQNYAPYGETFGGVGSFNSPFEFTGEQVDPTGQLYLRARHYNPSLGVFPSLDPFEGTMQRPMSLNGYSWVEGNTPNMVDPTGMAMVDIWVAAFIAPNMIEFPFAADPTADWHGDGRSWHTLADFGNPPLSSRAWWSIRFDTNDLSTMTSQTDTGATSVTYGGVLGVYTSHGKAPSPAPATVECTGPDSDDPFILNDVWVQIEEDAKNPLISYAPPIEISYSILIMPQTGQINVTRDIDRYPWHELHIAVDGVSVVQLQQSPLGPFENPADLSLPSLRSVFTNIGSFPPDGPCKSSRNQPPLPIPMPTPPPPSEVAG